MSLMDNCLGNHPPFFNMQKEHVSFARYFTEDRSPFDVECPAGWYGFEAKSTPGGCKFWSQRGPFEDEASALAASDGAV